MKKTYIDISHIALWSGRLSGIERVEYNIIKHYLVEGSGEFVCWSEQTGLFHEKTTSQIETLLKNIEDSQQATHLQYEKSTSLKHKISLKLKIKKIDEPVVVFDRGDKLLVLDGLWDKQSYIDALKKIAGQASIHHIVYDMIPILKQGFVLDFIVTVFENYMKTILPLCDYVYAISENSAKDTKVVMEKWGVELPSIESFRLGDDILVTSKKSRNEDEDFILATGTIEVRKNYPLLAYTYALANERGIKLPKIFIVGKRGWLSGDFQYQVEHDAYLKEMIHIKDNVTDNELAELYSSAMLIVCPSFYEGWGLPVREALAYGKVTLSSNTSSLPEAGGVFADYFSPHNPEELLRLFVKYIDSSQRQKRQKEIETNYKPFTWKQSSKEFAEKIAKNN